MPASLTKLNRLGGSAKTMHRTKPPRPVTLCLAAILLAVLVGIAYARAVRAQFLNYDDTIQVVVNEHINTGVSLANVKWAFTQPFASNYVPLTWLSHMTCCQI